MSRIKQHLLDILESREEGDELPEYRFPNHPIYPTKTATFCNGKPKDTDDAEVSTD